MTTALLTAPAQPFRATPDPAYHFEGRTQTRARAYLSVGLQRGEGIQVLTGDAGCGKTTLIRSVLEVADPQVLCLAYLPGTHTDDAAWPQAVAAAFGCAAHGLPAHEALAVLEAHLIQQAVAGRASLLVVDEAQALSVQGLESLRLLSNLQLGAHALLQILLVGQTSLRTRLHEPGLKLLAQRVGSMAHLDPLAPDEVQAYVEHRLTVAGRQHDVRFEADLWPVMYAQSEGVPRRINLLAERLMMVAELSGRVELHAADLELVADEWARETSVDAEGWHDAF